MTRPTPDEYAPLNSKRLRRKSAVAAAAFIALIAMGTTLSQVVKANGAFEFWNVSEEATTDANGTTAPPTTKPLPAALGINMDPASTLTSVTFEILTSSGVDLSGSPLNFQDNDMLIGDTNVALATPLEALATLEVLHPAADWRGNRLH